MASSNSLNSRLLGQVVRACRKRSGMSQEIVAGLAGISRNHIGEIERGESIASFEVVAKIVAALGVSLEEFGKLYEAQNKKTNDGTSK
jgi:transcriptional regulator with XRE-family HTH domain